MKRNIAGLILSGLMVVLLTACGESGANPEVPEENGANPEVPEENGANPEVPEENGANPEGPPETTTLDGVTYTVIVEESDFDKMRSDLTGNYYLWRDIALTGDFEPIAPHIETDPSFFLFEGTPFTGIFEGNNKTIRNLGIAKSSENYVGFFGQIGENNAFDPANPDANGVVRNLTLELTAGTVDAPSIEGAGSVGALAGSSYGKIEAVGVEGGFVKGGGINVGGLVGVSYGNITSSYATGSVEGTVQHVGGLVGYVFNGTITSSYAKGSVKGTGSNVGGLVGYVFNGTINSSYAMGLVTGAGSNVGGLVGNFAGGGTITSSYATGSVTLTGAGSNVGGLVGFSNGTITSSYFDTSSTSQTLGIGKDDNNQSGNVTGYDSSSGSVRYNGTDVTQSNFSTWDFNTVWRWVTDGQWPLLAWQ